MVICLNRGADLHMAQLMPLPLTVSCFSKIQIGFTFLVPAHPGSPGQRAVKRVSLWGGRTLTSYISRKWQSGRSANDFRLPKYAYSLNNICLDVNEARDYGVLGWQWHQLDHMQTICTSLQTDNHTNTSSLIFTCRMPFLTPTNSVRALKARNDKQR